MTKIIDRSGKGAAISATENDANLSSLSGINAPITATTHTIDVDDQNDTIEYLNAAAIAVTLPAISTVSGSNIHTDDFTVTLKNIGAGVVTITRGSTDTFDDGSTSIELAQYEWATIQTDSSLTKWNIINNKPKGWQLLSVQEASASATIDFTSAEGIGSRYDYYKIEFYNVYCDTTGLLRARASIASVFQTTGNYSSVSSTATGSSGSSWRINAVVTDSASTGGGVTHGTLQFTLGNATTDHEPVIIGQIATGSSIASNRLLAESISLTYTISGAVTAIDGLRFFASSGNIAQGTFMLYGMSK